MFAWMRKLGLSKRPTMQVAQSAEEACQYKPWILVSQDEIIQQPNYIKIARRLEKTQSEWINSHLSSTVAKHIRLYTPEQILHLCIELGTIDAVTQDDANKTARVKQLMALLVSAVYYKFKVPAWVTHFLKMDIFLEEYAMHLQLATPMQALNYLKHTYSRIDKVEHVSDEEYERVSYAIDGYQRDVVRILANAARETASCITINGVIHEWGVLKRLQGQGYAKVDAAVLRATVTYVCSLSSLICSRDCLTPDETMVTILMRKLGEIEHEVLHSKPGFFPKVIANTTDFPPTEPRRNHLRVVTTE